jgi:serine/threonine protein kinase
MGQVFEAVHLAVGSHVAVKVMQPQQRDVRVAVQRFHKEARILGAVKHPNAVLITDFDVDHRPSGAIAFLVTELLRGRSLAALLDERGRLGIEDVERIIVPLCEAVEDAHAQGIIHRDLKPSNVFLERLRDGTEVVKVLDFGIAKLLARRDDDDVPAPIVLPPLGDRDDDQAEQTLRDEILLALDDDAVGGEARTLPGRGQAAGAGGGAPHADRSTFAGLMVGTVPYMAAEQMTGERVTRRTDVHALAVLIFEMLSGRLPFDGDDDDVIDALVLGPA